MKNRDYWRGLVRTETPARVAEKIQQDLIGYRKTSLHWAEDVVLLTVLIEVAIEFGRNPYFSLSESAKV